MSASERGLEISQESVRGGVRRMLSRGGAIGGARWLFAPLKTCRIPFPQEHRSISPYCNKIGPDQAVLMSVRPSILLQFEVRKCAQVGRESADFSKFSGGGPQDPPSRLAVALRRPRSQSALRSGCPLNENRRAAPYSRRYWTIRSFRKFTVQQFLSSRWYTSIFFELICT